MNKLILIALFSLSSSLFTLSRAQYPDIFSFNGTNGSIPFGDLTLSGAQLYGMTSLGGVNGLGCIFRIDTTGKGYKDIFDFGGANGEYPYGNLTLVGKIFYGMTSEGGAHNAGCIFSIDTNGIGYKDLFDFKGTNGAIPWGSLIYSSGVLYGMTTTGGMHDSGCIFSIDTNGNRYKDLLDFSGANGKNPNGSLVLSDSMLYGMAGGGGANSYGTLFAIDTNGKWYKDLLDFNYVDGSTPNGALIIANNVLYGMTKYGLGEGSVFSIHKDGSGFRNLYNFHFPKGYYPLGSLTLSGKLLYGMTSGGGSGNPGPPGNGDLFAIDTNGNEYRQLLYFNGGNGDNPHGSLTILGGSLYGMALGGASGNGVIFKVDTSSLSSVYEVESKEGIVKMFPNPNNGMFQLGISNYKSGTDDGLEIYNMLGEKIYHQKLSCLNSINISRQSPGLYFYRVITETGVLVFKGNFIIQ